jgi:hypothetical protein
VTAFSITHIACSTVVDHDLMLADEYREALPRFRSLAPPPGKAACGFDDAYAPVGVAVVWLLPIPVTHGGLLWLERIDAHVVTDGDSDVYMFAASLTSWLIMLFGLLLCVDLAAPWFSERVALAAVLSGWLGSPLLVNAYELPTFTTQSTSAS